MLLDYVALTYVLATAVNAQLPVVIPYPDPIHVVKTTFQTEKKNRTFLQKNKNITD
jgi:hypothetical protein